LHSEIYRSYLEPDVSRNQFMLDSTCYAKR